MPRMTNPLTVADALGAIDELIMRDDSVATAFEQAHGSALAELLAIPKEERALRAAPLPVVLAIAELSGRRPR